MRTATTQKTLTLETLKRETENRIKFMYKM